MPNNALDIGQIVTIISGIAGVLSFIGTLWLSRNKPKRDEAEAAALITKAASDLVDDLVQQIAALKARIDQLEASDAKLVEEIRGLRARVQELEHENRKLAEENRVLKGGL